MRKINRKSKRGVSLIISYAILIGIVLAISIGVFIWLKDLANFQPVVSCKDGSSLSVSDYSCDGKSINLSIKNNGRFGIDGFILRVGDNELKTPITYLNVRSGQSGLQSTLAGNALFQTKLDPSQTIDVVFTNQETNNRISKTVNYPFIKILQLQPYIFVNKQRIICDQVVIKQKIENCVINSGLSG